MTDDDTWLDVAAVEAFKPGTFRIVETDDYVIAVFNVFGAFHAFEDVCTHDGE
jgi:3-phenylpropionate/trans-cinnamate dioxygenase ferredoxin subunit